MFLFASVFGLVAQATAKFKLVKKTDGKVPAQGVMGMASKRPTHCKLVACAASEHCTRSRRQRRKKTESTKEKLAYQTQSPSKALFLTARPPGPPRSPSSPYQFSLGRECIQLNFYFISSQCLVCTGESTRVNGTIGRIVVMGSHET